MVFGKRATSILMLGLDGAGKTTILYKLKFGKAITTIPTYGFNLEDIKYNGKSFSLWDFGGDNRIRSIWHCYYVYVEAIVYVVDSANTERMPEARRVMHHVLSNRETREVLLLILANKQDLPNVLDAVSLAKKFHVDDWPCHVQPCSAVSGEGLHEGLDWLTKVLGQKVSYPSDNGSSILS
ncbi:hypothetical protein FRC15_004552 [Serendipita sp. 397]|nr:hypothetical protein FRC15_004552 [Serendipita sp. 397]